MADFVSLNTALSALRAARIRIDVASHNVANASTEGYTRQRVDLKPNPVFSTPVGAIGTGVEVEQIARIRDGFLDARVRTAGGSYGSFSVQHDLLDRAEQILAEPDQGISGRLSDLWASFEELALSPSNTGARIAVIGSLEDVAARVGSIATQWQRLGEDVANHLQVRVREVNDMLQAVAELNRQINENLHGGVPNDLMDQRDLLIDRLANAIGAQALQVSDTMVRVSLGGMALVDGTTSTELVLRGDNTIAHASGVTLETGGEIGGYQRFLLDDLPALNADLNAFARDLADALNARHALGYRPDGSPGGPLLDYTAGMEAATLRVLVSAPGDIAAADAPGQVNNGRNAQALADLRGALVARGGLDTLEGSVRSLAVDLGARVAVARRGAESQQSLLAAAELARDGHHGVSLDEEMTALMEAQHQYNAAARTMTVVDEALDTLINRMGIVGR